eukprot:4533841-Prymnesium_polylepis.1
MADAQLFKSVFPLEYANKFLAAGVRPDGRSLLKARRTRVHVGSISHVDGSARVRLGQTVILAGVQCVPTPPTDAEPTRGRVVVSLEVAGVSSPAAAAAAAR